MCLCIYSNAEILVNRVKRHVFESKEDFLRLKEGLTMMLEKEEYMKEAPHKSGSRSDVLIMLFTDSQTYIVSK